MKLILKRNLLIALFAIVSACNSTSNNQPAPSQGEMSFQSENIQEQQITVVDEALPPQKTEEEVLAEQGWKREGYSNGVMPNCYNYSPKYGQLENELRVTVGGGTDAVIKVMSIEAERCIRYVYINSGNTYSIGNIPEGRYYLKIAYGRNWISRTSNEVCEGKFTSNALYEKGEDVLDFNKQETFDGYSIPSFSLKLDVVSGASENTFNSNGISEDDFNR